MGERIPYYYTYYSRLYYVRAPPAFTSIFWSHLKRSFRVFSAKALVGGSCISECRDCPGLGFGI